MYLEKFRLAGKTAVVTGGGQGIGLASVEALAEAGAKVVIADRDAKVAAQGQASLKAKGYDVEIVDMDVTNSGQVAAVAAQLVARHGKVDILVNNAGQSQAHPILEVSDEAWQADFDLKVFAALRLVRLCMPQMQERKWGRIINVLNIGAKAPAPSSTPTSVSRAAGMALTKAMAGEGGAHNILVNAMLVGLIVSDQWVQRHAKTAGDTDFDAYTKNLAKGVPLGRMGTAEEFANLACFLASEQGSYITGTAINVDGGRSPVV
jgi:3-oxoacyl-[acyl-carrier protein] reductase